METTEENATPVVVEKSYNAPVAKVWEALTDNEKMKQWYFVLPEFKAEVGFEFEFTGGDPNGKMYLHKCVVKEVVPDKKLAYSWRYDGYEGDSLVTFELFEEGTGTRVRVTHTGLETFPAIEAFAPKNFNMGWNAILGSTLRDFVEKA
ncbi:MAG: SRPBCC domain-containing protein [Bacteroidota bacterium]